MPGRWSNALAAVSAGSSCEGKSRMSRSLVPAPLAAGVWGDILPTGPAWFKPSRRVGGGWPCPGSPREEGWDGRGRGSGSSAALSLLPGLGLWAWRRQRSSSSVSGFQVMLEELLQ